MSLEMLKVASLQGWALGACAKERGLENVFPEAPGTCSALSCVFAPGPWVLPCQECHLPPPSLLKSYLLVKAQLRCQLLSHKALWTLPAPPA